MNCQDCLAERRYKEESTLALAERTIRRLWIVILVLIVMLTGVCIGFFLYESQFEEYAETSTEETEVDAWQFGDGNFAAGGDISYATTGTCTED